MSETRQYIAVDLGAESGRVMLGSVSAERITLTEVYRFSNETIETDTSLRWDFDSLLTEVKRGIARAAKKAEGSISGIGVDSWGVDFGLLDAQGKLIENPYHYRDGRTNGMMDAAFELMGNREIYENTGLQFLQFNTIYQLLATKLNNPDVLAKADKLIFVADLITYFLCGRRFAEYTLASTSQLMDMRTGQWSEVIFDKLGFAIEIMPDVIKPGTVVGQLSQDIAREVGCGRIPIIAVASHDTASAVAAVPAAGKSWAYISSGTWSLIGVEVHSTIINDKSFEYSFTNEGGVEGTIRFLKNVMGLWLIQQCRRQWTKRYSELSYFQMTEMAKEAEPFTAYIDPDMDEFLLHGNMPGMLNKYLSETGQEMIGDKGQMVRVILESLAFKYRWVLERIEDITDKEIYRLHMVGGGIQNEVLCQFTADVTDKEVIAGPTEATAIGNILMQARAVGQVESLAQARAMLRNSFEMKKYRPSDVLLWERKYEKFKVVTGVS